MGVVSISSSLFALEIPNTGTRYGSTYHQRLLSCVKKEYYYQLGHQREDIEESENLLRGSFYHHLQRKRREGIRYRIEFDGNPEATTQKALKMAVRQVETYWTRFPDGLWPTIAIEEPLGVSPEEQARLGAILPYVQATGQLDLRTDLNDFDAEIVGSQIGQFVVPGRYIIDYKSGGYFDAKKLAQYKMSLQGRLYMVLYNLLRAEKVQGIIYDCISSHVGGPQSHFAIKYFDSLDEQYVHELWTDLAEQRRLLASGDLRANKAACFSGYKTCPYLGTLCNQLHERVPT